jgi:thiamine biosynthesis lipoprotein
MPPDRPVASHHFDAMGTTCSLFGVDVAPGTLVEGEAWVRRTASLLTRFASGSELSRLNASAGRWIDVGEELESVLREALRAHELSLGLVNVAVLRSMLAIGYVRPLSEGPNLTSLDWTGPLTPLPEVLEIRPRQARVRAGCGIDLGGIAKGWMADRLCEMLGANGVANLGGDLRAVGLGPSGGGWAVGVGDVTLMLRGQGAATSSVRKRRWGDVHHLIDPRTGLPARSGLTEVSVVAASGVEAEVIAKTALLLGPDLAPAYCAMHALAWSLSDSHDG